MDLVPLRSTQWPALSTGASNTGSVTPGVANKSPSSRPVSVNDLFFMEMGFHTATVGGVPRTSYSVKNLLMIQGLTHRQAGAGYCELLRLNIEGYKSNRQGLAHRQGFELRKGKSAAEELHFP